MHLWQMNMWRTAYFDHELLSHSDSNIFEKYIEEISIQMCSLHQCFTLFTTRSRSLSKHRPRNTPRRRGTHEPVAASASDKALSNVGANATHKNNVTVNEVWKEQCNTALFKKAFKNASVENRKSASALYCTVYTVQCTQNIHSAEPGPRT